jgi:cytochrome c
MLVNFAFEAARTGRIAVVDPSRGAAYFVEKCADCFAATGGD